MPNEAVPTLISHPGFDDAYEEIDDPDLCREVELALMDIRANPFEPSRFLQAEYEGYRSYSRGRYRIVFVVCSECIGKGYIGQIDCSDCVDIHGEGQESPQQIIKLIHLDDAQGVSRAA